MADRKAGYDDELCSRECGEKANRGVHSKACRAAHDGEGHGILEGRASGQPASAAEVRSYLRSEVDDLRKKNSKLQRDRDALLEALKSCMRHWIELTNWRESLFRGPRRRGRRG